MNTHAFLIAGTLSGCGKTMVSLGIMAALRERGLIVQSFNEVKGDKQFMCVKKTRAIMHCNISFHDIGWA